jgi:osmoprotectant transport system substrate-binding protein
VKQLDLQKGLVWLQPSRVNNTYALAMRRADASDRRIATISDLAARVLQGERLNFASGAEFYERSDGLGPLQQAYGFQFGREHVVRLDPDRVYQVLRDWRLIDVGMVFATDGRIAAYDLLVLEDDKEFFPNYGAAQ